MKQIAMIPFANVVSTPAEREFRQKWMVKANRDYRVKRVEELLACRCGAPDCYTGLYDLRLGRRADHWGNQPAYDFREISWARRLHVDRGYRLCDIVYQACPLFGASGVPGELSRRREKIAAVFTPHFFARLGALYEANGVDKTRNGWHVDFFGMSSERNECGFWEVKAPDEDIGDHQNYLLAFVRHLADTEAATILREPGMTLITEFGYFGAPKRPLVVPFEDPAKSSAT